MTFLKLYRLYRKSKEQEEIVSKWYENVVQKNEIVNKISPGHFYSFQYNPIYEKRLEVYDRFPLVFVYNQKRYNFFGINFHHLIHFEPRREALYFLMKLNRKKFNEDIDFFMNTIKIIPFWKPMVKQYATTQIFGGFVYKISMYDIFDAISKKVNTLVYK